MNKNRLKQIITIVTVVAVVIVFIALQDASQIEAEVKTYSTELMMGQEVDSDNVEVLTVDESDEKNEHNTDIQETSENLEIDTEVVETSEVPTETVEEIKQESSEETVEIDEPTIPELTEEQRQEKAEEIAPRNVDLKANEIIVDSYSEFKSLVLKKGNGVYDTYYMSQDFTMDSGFTVPTGYGFTLDGLNRETGEIHSFEVSTTSTTPIASSGAAERTLQFRNMNIVGKSTNGVFRSTSGAGITHLFDNVVYNGPLLSYNASGTTIYRDSTIINEVKRSSSFIFRGGLDTTLRIEGKTLLDDSKGPTTDTFNFTRGNLIFGENSDVTILSSGRLLVSSATYEKSVIFEEGSNVNILIDATNETSMNTVFNATNFIANSSTITAEVKFGKLVSEFAYVYENVELNDTVVNVTMPYTYGVFNAEQGIDVSNGSIINANVEQISRGILASHQPTGTGIYVRDSEVNANIENLNSSIIISRAGEVVFENSKLNSKVEKSTASELYGQKNLTITNSDIDIEVDQTQQAVFGSGGPVIIDDSDINVAITGSYATAKRYSYIEGSSYTSTNSRVEFQSADTEFKYIFGVKESISVNDSLGRSTWHSFVSEYDISLVDPGYSPTVELNIQQFNVYGKKSAENTEPEIHYQRPDYTQGTMKFKVEKGQVGDFSKNDFAHEGYPNPEEEFNVNERHAISMGNIPLEESDQNSLESYAAIVNPNSWVEFHYNNMEEKQEGRADKTGMIAFDLNPKANPQNHETRVFSHKLYRKSSVDYTVFGSMDLVSYPKTLNYGSIKIPTKHTLYDNLDTDKLIIEDTRFDKPGWKLEVRLKTPLSEPTGKGRDLSDAIVYKETNESETIELTSKPILIYETSDGYDDLTEINFNKGEGILLELFGANGLYEGLEYTGEIEWILTSK